MSEDQGEARQGRPAAPNPSIDVFISYASQDKAVAEAVCKALERAGVLCWIAPRNVIAGEFYAESIVHAIDSAKVLVLILSQNATNSLHVIKEVERASSKRHPVVPFRIDAAPLPASLEYFLNTAQWLDASAMGVVRALPRLVDAVKTALKQSFSPARVAPVPAIATSSKPRTSLMLVVLVAIVAAGLVYFIADKFWLAKHAPAKQPMTTATSLIGDKSTAVSVKSVAVLPFENFSGVASDTDLADGLQEEILNALARLRDLKVISRTSVMEFRGNTHNVREIGQKLGVGSILEGSIRRDSGVLRLTVQLVDARDDRHLLAANYDRDQKHVLNLQSAVARQVADALAATLNSYERGELDRVATNSGDAYDRYLRALAKFRKPVPNDYGGLTEPIHLLEQALRFDPDYVDALALLSQSYTFLYLANERAGDGAKALQADSRAISIDPNLPEARLARGLYALYVSEDPEQALADLEAVVQLRPNSALAHQALGFALRRRGRFAEALPHLVRAWDLDPLNAVYAGGPFDTLMGLRRFPEAIEQTKLRSNRFPDDFDAYGTRGYVEGLLQHSVEPLRVALRDHGDSLDPESRRGVEMQIALWEGRFLDVIKLASKNPVDDSGTTMWKAMWMAMLEGFWYRAGGDARNAELSFRRSEQAGRAQMLLKRPYLESLTHMALVESMLGEHKAALATIERARNMCPEARDAVNGPGVSFTRSVVLVRAGYAAEGYAEATRLLHVPFGAPPDYDVENPLWLLIKDDPKYDEILHHPPRL